MINDDKVFLQSSNYCFHFVCDLFIVFFCFCFIILAVYCNLFLISFLIDFALQSFPIFYKHLNIVLFLSCVIIIILE